MTAIPATIRTSARARLPAPPSYVVAGVICWSAASGGLDSAIGQGIFCLVHCGLLAWLVLSEAYSPSILRENRRLFGLLMLAWLWSIGATWSFVGTIPEEAYARMARNFGAMAVLLSALIISRIPGRRERILDWIAIQLAAISIGALIAWAAGSSIVTWAEGLESNRRFQGFVGNVNVNATLAASATVWSGWRTLTVWSTWYKWPIRRRLLSVALVGAFCTNFVVVVLSATRTINFALALILFVGLAAYGMRRRPDLRPTKRHVAIAAGLIVAIFAIQRIGLLGERYDNLDEGLSSRLAIWGRCFAMLAERPLSGFGLGSFPATYAHFLPEPRTAAQIWTVNSPHNAVLQILLTGGVVYLALLGSAAFMIARTVVSALQHGRAAPDHRPLSAMLLVILGSASVDIALDYPLTIGLFGLLVGFLLGQSLYRRKVAVAHPSPEPG